MARVRLGMVHGRFQPFHLGHLAYLRGAAARSERLLVGITNPDRLRTVDEPADPARGLPEANPWSYTERLLMLAAVLADEGLADALVIPFPVGQPELWPDYVPAGTTHFLRVFDAWGEEKAARLRAAGFAVEVLDVGAPKEVTGTEVRARLAAGGDWEALVPAGTARVLRELGEA